MKKRWLLLLLVPLLALTMISCDADMRAKLAETMGKLGSNVYLDAKIVKPNLADATAVADIVSSLGQSGSIITAGEDNKVTVFGEVEVVTSTGTTLKPQSPEEQGELKDKIGASLTSDKQKEELKKELGNKVTDEDRKKAAKGAIEVINGTIEKLVPDENIDPSLREAIEQLMMTEIDLDEDVTEGDLLLAQMMTNLIANSIEVIEGGIDAADMDSVSAIIEDAFITAEVAAMVGRSDDIPFFKDLDFGQLMDMFNSGDGSMALSKGTLSRDSGDEKNDLPEEFIGIFANFGPGIVSLTGLQKQGDGSYDWKPGDYRSFIANQQAFRGSLELGLTLAIEKELKVSKDTFGLVTVVQYILSVVFTEIDEWGKQPSGSGGENTGRYLLRTIVSSNPWLVVGAQKGDQFELPEDDAELLKSFLEYLQGEEDELFESDITEKIIKIVEIGGIEELESLLQKDKED